MSQAAVEGDIQRQAYVQVLLVVYFSSAKECHNVAVGMHKTV